MTPGAQTFLFTPSGTQYQDYTFGPVTATAASQSVGFMAVPQSSSVAAAAMLDNVRVVLSAAPFTPAGLSLYPATVTGGSSSLGTVTLSSYAPPAGVVVALQSSNPAATVPASVTVPGGQRSATFSVTTTDVPAASTATISATAGGVTQTATLTIIQNLSLTAAATGSNKVTLYWNGITGASGYNVYRGTASGGPYSLVAANVTTADPGPGMMGSFMYSDAAGLATGTEYFYIVWAVQGGAETIQSDEASATPGANAIPWDTGDPAQIISAVNSMVQPTLEPDIDPDTGDEYPATVGILSACGPNGVLYQGNYTDATPATAYPPSAYYDSNSGTIIYADGTAASAPAEGDDNADASPPSGMNSGMATMDALLSPSFQISDLYNYKGNNTGIWRKGESVPGFWGAAGTCGLPNLNDPNSVVLAVHSFPPGALDRHNNPLTSPYSDSGDIYFGGSVHYTGAADNPNNSSFELDAGLQASANLASTSVPGWVPVINPAPAPGVLRGANVKSRQTVVTGLVLGVANGNLVGRKIYAIHETRMQFITPRFANLADQTVVLHLAKPIGGVAGGDILVAPVMRVGAGLSLGAPTSYDAATLVYFAQGWRSTAINNARGNNLFSIKRTNSIAQTLHDANHPAPAYPSANGPSESNVKSFLIDSSAVRGAYWGNNGDSRGVELNTNGSWTPWTDDNSQSLHSGAYPNSKYGGYGYVIWNNNNGFTWETNINLKANHTLP